MKLSVNPRSLDDYRTFLAVKRLPLYSVCGRELSFPDEYAERIGQQAEREAIIEYDPPQWMWDYQKAISRIAIQKQKYALFWDCGLGKTAVLFEFAKQAQRSLKRKNRGVLIVSPLNVICQTIAESEKFYGTGGIGIEQVHAAALGEWLNHCGGKIGITNYDALRIDLRQRRLGALILDESSYLKSHYGKWGQVLLRLGAGLDWKLCCTGTPAPNDRIEYANHAVFLDAFRNVNAFLATFFVNRGQTQNRWELKPHALRPFYRALSHWCIFLTDPRTYGWHDNTESIPPIHTHIEHVPMTDEQKRLVWSKTGELFSNRMGGITHRGDDGPDR